MKTYTMKAIILTLLGLFIYTNNKAQPTLFGVTRSGGANTFGALFSYNFISNNYTKQFDFDGNNTGSYSESAMVQATDGNLYGLTYTGGANNLGVLFQYNPSTNVYTKKINFDGSNKGTYPQGALIQASNGNLYGVTEQGGTNDEGVLFQYNPATNVYTKLLDFSSATTGALPKGGVLQANDGKLYGTNFFGGANNEGVLYTYDITTNVFTKKIDFASALNGGYPLATLIQATDSNLYGTTWTGGVNNKGTLFNYIISTNTCTKKIDFDGAINGSEPNGALMQANNGTIYGMTYNGGINNKGTLFGYNIATSTITNLLNFDGINNGSLPQSALMQASNGSLYGVTAEGGTNNSGVLFSYNTTTNAYNKLVDYTVVNGSNPTKAHLIEVNLCKALTPPIAMFTLAKDTSAPYTWTATPTYMPSIVSAKWHWGDSTSTTGFITSHTYADSGLYTICLTVTDSCNNKDSVCMTSFINRSSSAVQMVIVNVTPTIITTLKAPLQNTNLSITPNPNNGSFTIHTSTGGNYTIVNELGQVLKNFSINSSINYASISGLSSGVYYLVANNNTSITHKKIIVAQ
jgi:uncharacterized repeat protein (TIGR03803 family)